MRCFGYCIIDQDLALRTRALAGVARGFGDRSGVTDGGPTGLDFS